MLTLVVRRLLFLRPDKPGPVGTTSEAYLRGWILNQRPWERAY
jgi:hypothetical protein